MIEGYVGNNIVGYGTSDPDEAMQILNFITGKDSLDYMCKDLKNSRHRCKPSQDHNPDPNSGYNKGLTDAWALIAQIIILSDEKRKEIFGIEKTIDIMATMNYDEVSSILRSYSKRSNFEVGDEVRISVEGKESKFYIANLRDDSVDGIDLANNTAYEDIDIKILEKTGNKCPAIKTLLLII